MCDPENEVMCLYGNYNGSWEVKLPSEEAPPELPQPILGINIVRDAMQNKEWRSFVAVHCDSWLISLAFCFAGLFGFGQSERSRLFDLVNELPTVYEEVVNEEAKPPKHQVSYKKGSQRKSSQEKQPCGAEHHNPINVPALSNENEEIGRGGLLCSTGEDDIWIRCEMCDRWFRDQFESKQYKCRNCRNNKRAKVNVIWVPKM